MRRPRRLRHPRWDPLPIERSFYRDSHDSLPHAPPRAYARDSAEQQDLPEDVPEPAPPQIQPREPVDGDRQPDPQKRRHVLDDGGLVPRDGADHANEKLEGV